eukprot:TRINITY_DN2013_c0_g2_i4.p1 TRINITY_DN2013_c0_g2~~TRINITY_DN2013_c0_g2_i4.p1  ORF type:complete len:162 (+),score=26.82 TRINITY_DN2013_c0_g2_i4:35-520(+)
MKVICFLVLLLVISHAKKSESLSKSHSICQSVVSHCCAIEGAQEHICAKIEEKLSECIAEVNTNELCYRTCIDECSQIKDNLAEWKKCLGTCEPCHASYKKRAEAEGGESEDGGDLCQEFLDTCRSLQGETKELIKICDKREAKLEAVSYTHLTLPTIYSV